MDLRKRQMSTEHLSAYRLSSPDPNYALEKRQRVKYPVFRVRLSPYLSFFANLVEGYEGYDAKPHIIPDYEDSKPVEGHPQGIEYRAIPHHITEGIRAIARRHHVNAASVYEGVYAFMAYTQSGSSDLAYRRVSTGRTVPFPKIRSISGTFVATSPTRVRFSADMTFA